MFNTLMVSVMPATCDEALKTPTKEKYKPGLLKTFLTTIYYYLTNCREINSNNNIK